MAAQKAHDPSIDIGKICGGLKRYYEYCGKGDDYKVEDPDTQAVAGIFTTFCNESCVSIGFVYCIRKSVSTSFTLDGFDEDAVDDELTVQLDENQLLECWDDIDFPFHPNNTPTDDDAKKQFILDLLLKLAKNPDLHFGSNIPTC